jgi:hypothetical protein
VLTFPFCQSGRQSIIGKSAVDPKAETISYSDRGYLKKSMLVIEHLPAKRRNENSSAGRLIGIGGDDSPVWQAGE